MKILVTGATGFIATALIKRLKEQGHAVSSIGRSFENNVEKITSFMKEEKCDGVIHLASLFLVQHTPQDLKNLIDSNILFPTAVLEASVAAKIPWFINTGTFWQHYEDKAYSPINLYAATKQAFEDIARYYIESSEINFVTIDLFNVFGPQDTRSKVFNLWLKISESGEILEMSPGEQILDITYIDNVTSGYLRMIELLSRDTEGKLRGQSFSLQSPERMTLRKLAELFERTTGRKLHIEWGKKNYRPREVMIPWQKGKKIPGWKPVISLEEGIRRTFSHYNS